MMWIDNLLNQYMQVNVKKICRPSTLCCIFIVSSHAPIGVVRMPVPNREILTPSNIVSHSLSLLYS